MHDTIGCYLDLDKGQISFSKNGAVSVVIIVVMFFAVCNYGCLVINAKVSRVLFLSVFFQVMTWVWLLRFLNT